MNDSQNKKSSTSKHKGLTIVYTGNGKGKTTAALGIIFRALGRKMNVGVVQFIKGKWVSGERKYAESLDDVEFKTMGEGFTWESDNISVDKTAAQAAWDKSKEMIASEKFNVVILDELTYAIHYDFISLNDVLDAVKSKPENLHLVITGRNAPQELIDLADLATEMKLIKHPYEKGIAAQVGIDY